MSVMWVAITSLFTFLKQNYTSMFIVANSGSSISSVFKNRFTHPSANTRSGTFSVRKIFYVEK